MHTATTSTRDIVARILYSAVAEIEKAWEGPEPDDLGYPVQRWYEAWCDAQAKRKRFAERLLRRCTRLLGGSTTECGWTVHERRWTERQASDLNVDTATAWIHIPGFGGAPEPLGDGDLAMLAFQAAGRLKSLARELDISDPAAQDLSHALGWHAIDMMEVPAPYNGRGLKKVMDEAGW